MKESMHMFSFFLNIQKMYQAKLYLKFDIMLQYLRLVLFQVNWYHLLYDHYFYLYFSYNHFEIQMEEPWINKRDRPIFRQEQYHRMYLFYYDVCNHSKSKYHLCYNYCRWLIESQKRIVGFA